MGLTDAYLTVTRNLGQILNAIRNAQAPKRFTTRFLVDLGFRSTNDRLVIGILKALGFLDESGAPRERYFAYLDETQSKRILTEAIVEAYGDLFQVNNKANEMTQIQVKQKLKTLTRGSKSDAVLRKMATTFKALCQYADFKALTKAPRRKESEVKPEIPLTEKDKGRESVKPSERTGPARTLDLCYSIHIELPSTRDKAIYDAIFRSLKEHIL